MARKPSTRKRREPAPAASTRAEPAVSNKRPTTKPGAACLERVLTRDATHFNLVAQLVEWCGCAAPLCVFEATSKTCAEAARTPVKLALTTATEAKPLASLVRSHASRRKLSMAAAGRRLVVLEAADGAHSNIALEATEGGLYRPRAAPPEFGATLRIWGGATRIRQIMNSGAQIPNSGTPRIRGAIADSWGDSRIGFRKFKRSIHEG